MYQEIIEEVYRTLGDHEDVEYAEKMSAYMKGHFHYFGIRSPQRKDLSKAAIHTLAKEYGQAHHAILRDCWEYDEREMQYVGLEVLFKSWRYWNEETLDLMEELIVKKAWWDTVDALATKGVGRYFQLHPEERLSRTEEWNKGENLWLIRTSILFQLKYKDELDQELLYKYICRHFGSSEFFINKSIGWVLREYAKRKPDEVRVFIQTHEEDLAPLSIREALKHIGR